MFEIEWTGISELQQAFESGLDEVLDELEKAVDLSGEHLLSVSMRLAPKLTGDLEGSGTKDPVQRSADEISVEIGFRGLPYARRRHEEVYNPGIITRGKPSVDGMTPGRKYIEQPLNKYASEYRRDWAEAVKAALGRSFNK